MINLYLVRHGEAETAWHRSADAGLSELGREQAHNVANHFSALPPMVLVSSPLARARETAQPLAQQWQQTINIDPCFTEMPSEGIPLQERRQWIKQFYQQRWEKMPTNLQQWRLAGIESLRAVTEDSVIFTHFVLINAMVSAARKDTRVLQFSPGNGSITLLQQQEGDLSVNTLGNEDMTVVN